MTTATNLLVNRSDLRQTQIKQTEVPALADGQVLYAVERAALTANNVTYAVAGDQIGYWQFFPAEEGWGIVPLWGFATAVESRCEDIPVGDRVYGYFPMGSHLVVEPAKVTERGFNDASAHRASLPVVYNAYARTGGEPEALKALADARCLTFPLFTTSYLLYDYLLDNDCFGAQQILIGSASSKTGGGLARLLKHDPAISAQVVGLTSPGNVSFIEAVDACDSIVTYDNVADLDTSRAAVFVDMSGNGPLMAGLHKAFVDNLKASIVVGVTHWEAGRVDEPMPGPKPEMFFAPSQIVKRDEEWGAGAVMRKATEANIGLAEVFMQHIEVQSLNDAEALQQAWLDQLDGSVPPTIGQIVRW
ncbi:MAG: DUF2855 family protein [Pseudomonadaceae bacterium]|nr:DUF2855 family protein [Pseudomonadaceae bacterium]